MMQKCCDNCKYCESEMFDQVCIECRWVYENGERVPDNWQPKVRTNAECIRAMSDEDLCQLVMAIIRVDVCPMSCQCAKCVFSSICCEDDDRKKVIEWLKQPAED